jgi:sterol desaturase/sphingolipid hydroxylase (fatty acid hydroxylase superfamily)
VQILVAAPANAARCAATSRLQRLYLPSVAMALATVWLIWEGASVLERFGELGSSLRGALVELVGPIVLGFVLVVLVCERLWPAERRPLLARGHLQDAAFFAFFAAAIVPLVTLLGVAFGTLLTAHASWIQTSWTATWPRPVVVGVTLVAMDGCNWVAHWIEHRFRPLWRFHAVHHTQEELSVLTTFRTHPLVHTLSFLTATVPVVALMPDHALAPVLVTVYLCLGALPHANVPWSFGPVGRVLCSPAYHRLHHAVDGPYDVNLGIVLTVWDVLARRAVFPTPGATACRTGLAGRPIAVEQAGGRYRPLRVFSTQMVEPFATPERTTSVG